jgi:type VI secretion system protein VasG
VSMSQTAVPAPVEDRQRRLALLETELGILERETVTGTNHEARIVELLARKEAVGAELEALETQWREEQELVGRIHDLRSKLEDASQPLDADGNSDGIEVQRTELAGATTRLREIQGETPLVQPCVNGEAIADVVATWTGIPVKRMVTNEIRAVLTLEHRMSERVVGQNHALTAIAKAIQTSRAGLTDPRKPIGVFLMVGTSGVGKTETALTLAELLYGGEQNMTVLNMSEFKEEFKMSMLVGSPPGYVGYGEGGVLTEAVRRRPYSVILLDEMEKCHPAVHDMFYQVFDKGMLRDGEGRDIDFKNTVIIMTSNAGSDTIAALCADPETSPDAGGLAEALRPELLKLFKPAFLGRVTLVPYFPLGDEVLRQIVRLQLDRIGSRVAETYKARFSYASELVDAITARCREVETGARNIDHILNRGLLPELSKQALVRMSMGQELSMIEVSVDEHGEFSYVIH